VPSLLLVGAGGLAREVLAYVGDIGHHDVQLLDDNPELRGRDVGGTPVVGATALLPELLDRHPAAVVSLCLGSPRRPELRAAVATRLDLPPGRWATLVHPSALLQGRTSVGEGSTVLAGVIATADVTIGAHCVLMPACVLTHDVVLGTGATLAAGVRLSGNVHVGAGAYLGSGVTVREGVHIGAGAVVGMGSVVLADVPAAEVWAGNPARRLRGPAGA
jgi:sugar O-acyltransferase (sialic acid O-acetyltransferase NeuD family)